MPLPRVQNVGTSRDAFIYEWDGGRLREDLSIGRTPSQLLRCAGVSHQARRSVTLPVSRCEWSTDPRCPRPPSPRHLELLPPQERASPSRDRNPLSRHPHPPGSPRPRSAPAWCEVRPNLGIAVYGGNGVEIEPLLELPNDAALLVRATRRDFSIPVLAIWALPAPTYADAVLRSLNTAMEALPGEDLIVAGDFNLTPAVANRRDSTPSGAGIRRILSAWLQERLSLAPRLRVRFRARRDSFLSPRSGETVSHRLLLRAPSVGEGCRINPKRWADSRPERPPTSRSYCRQMSL
jgi:hypothetical protein